MASWIKALDNSKLQITESDKPLPSPFITDFPELLDDDDKIQAVPISFLMDDDSKTDYDL